MERVADIAAAAVQHLSSVAESSEDHGERGVGLLDPGVDRSTLTG